MLKKSLMLFLMLVFICGSASAEPYVDKMGEVIEEISLLNLLRGLYLSEEQAREISSLAIEAQRVRSAALTEIKALNSIPAMKNLRDELYTALAEAPPKIRGQVVKLDNAAHEITGQALNKIARMEEKIKRILAPGQQDIFWKFIPCIVPEVDFENPVRTGQAAASSRLMPALELIRNSSKEKWEKHGQAFINHVLKITENEAGKMTADVRNDLRRRLVKHCWKIRSMKEADFMIHKAKLAEDLLLINREHTQRSGFRTTGKIARFFLSPAAARVFPKWVKVHFGNTSPDKKTELKVPETDVPQSKSLPSAKEQGALGKDAEAKYFWEKEVPKALGRLAETPYFDHFQAAFSSPFSLRLFKENDKYVEKELLINNAARAYLKRDVKLKFYTLTPGNP
jgi:hypothetical protein